MSNLASPTIQSITAALVNTFELEKSLEVHEPIYESDGEFSAADASNPTFAFNIKGAGDPPAAFVLGSNGGGLAIAGVVDGKTIITNVKKSQGNKRRNDWEVSGMNYPSAAA